MSDRVHEAQAAYDKALREIGGSAAAEWLAEETVKRRLSFADRPICSVVSPLFFPGETYRAAMSAAGSVAAALDVAARAALRVEALRIRAGLSVPSFVAGDVDSPASAFVYRLDGFMGKDGVIRFLEANPDPGGMAHSDYLAKMFREGPVWRLANLDALEIRRESSVKAGIEAFEMLYAPPAAKTARLGVVGSAEKFQELGINDEMGLIFAELRARGHDVVPGVGADITVREEGVFFGGQRVDVVRLGDIRALGENYLQHPLLAALAFKFVPCLGGLALPTLISQKSIFALLTDPEFVSSLPSEIAAAVRVHVPWTRLVGDTTTTDSTGRAVELLDYIRRGRAHLVLKPVSGFGGAGVVLGWNKTEGEWEECIEAALKKPYVVQERVEPQTAEFSVVDPEGQLRANRYQFDFNPYVWCGSRPVGVWNRLSSGGLMNVTSGHGSEFALFPVG